MAKYELQLRNLIKPVTNTTKMNNKKENGDKNEDNTFFFSCRFTTLKRRVTSIIEVHFSTTPNTHLFIRNLPLSKFENFEFNIIWFLFHTRNEYFTTILTDFFFL